MKRHAALTGLAALVLVFAVSACGGSEGGGNSEIKGVLWQWNGLLEQQPTSLSAVPDPQNYLLTLNDDGTFNAKADCNNTAGDYKLSGNDLTLTLGPTTLAECGADSLSSKYIDLLGKVATWEIVDGQLNLGLENDGGSMYFSAG